MKRIILPILIACTAISAGGQSVFHDRDAELREVPEFHSIEIHQAIDLQLSQGLTSVAVSAPGPEARRAVSTQVHNGLLSISYNNRKLFRGSGRVRVYVSTPSLKRLHASGACDININGELKVSELTVELSGASDLKGLVDIGALRLDLSGASDVTLKGRAVNFNVDASGASHVKTYELKTDNCIISASGATDIQVTVNKVLNADASGATTIQYRGSGAVSEVKTSGASRISKKD